MILGNEADTLWISSAATPGPSGAWSPKRKDIKDEGGVPSDIARRALALLDDRVRTVVTEFYERYGNLSNLKDK
jgi:hypothetical protein